MYGPRENKMSDRLTIDGTINPFVRLVDLLPQGLRVDINRSSVSREHIVECRVEDPDNFRRLVIDDRLRFLVEQHGYREPTGFAHQVGVCKDIKFFQSLEEEHTVPHNPARP